MNDIGHVSSWSRLFAMKAQCDACLVRALGMHAENMARQSRGESMAYNDDSFMLEANAIDNLATLMAKL